MKSKSLDLEYTNESTTRLLSAISTFHDHVCMYIHIHTHISMTEDNNLERNAKTGANILQRPSA